MLVDTWDAWLPGRLQRHKSARNDPGHAASDGRRATAYHGDDVVLVYRQMAAIRGLHGPYTSVTCAEATPQLVRLVIRPDHSQYGFGFRYVNRKAGRLPATVRYKRDFPQNETQFLTNFRHINDSF